ncbi:MAG: hypothetical protein ABSE67_06760, partial [Xanthobacteraceae bacterium]
MRLQHALRRRRIRKLYALAVEIGVDQSAISRWRKGAADLLDECSIALPGARYLSRLVGYWTRGNGGAS